MGEATIRDVARAARVSVASVSRALNGHSNVRAETRERVVAAAAALGYVPHAGARSLSTARSHAIGAVIPDFHGEFFSEIVRGMDREASARGYQLLLSNMHADVDHAAQAMRAMRGRVDGLIVMAPQLAPEVLADVLPASLPAVLVNSPGDAGRPSLRVDNRGGIALMVRHLVDTGCRAIVHLAGRSGNLDARERRDGFEAAIAALLPDAPIRIVEGDFEEESGVAAARALLAEGEPFDAILAANDMMALGAASALREAGVDVPGTVAVTGFDDVPLARYLGLTTVRVDIAGLGQRAAARLLDRLQGLPGDATPEYVGASLVARATSRPLASKP